MLGRHREVRDKGVTDESFGAFMLVCGTIDMAEPLTDHTRNLIS